jgi:hypothetical protein
MAAGYLQFVAEPLQSELHALLQAIKVADQIWIGRVIFSTDCQVLTHAVSSLCEISSLQFCCQRPAPY